MTLKDYDKYLLENIEREQMAILGYAFLYNPEHIEYFISFKSGDYESCKKYVSENKDLIKMENVPTHLLEAAKQNVKMYNSLSEEGYRDLMIG